MITRAACLVGVLLIACTGCGSKITVDGTIQVPGHEDLGDCQTSSGYDDIATGAQVVISNADGKRVATGTLDPGKKVDDGTCEFAFHVEDVPSSDIYTVEVTHRGEVTFKKEDAGHVALTLGD